MLGQTETLEAPLALALVDLGSLTLSVAERGKCGIFLIHRMRSTNVADFVWAIHFFAPWNENFGPLIPVINLICHGTGSIQH